MQKLNLLKKVVSKLVKPLILKVVVKNLLFSLVNKAYFIEIAKVELKLTN